MPVTHGIMYHHFHDNELHIKGQGSISAQEFSQMLDFYKKEYRIISAREYLLRAAQSKLEENEICITFDDSLKCQYDIAYPILKERNLTAFWFVYTSPLEGNLERLEIYRHFRFSMFSDIEEFYSEFYNTTISLENEINCDVQKKLHMFEVDKYLREYPFYTINDKKYRYLRDIVLGTEKYNYIMELLLEKYAYDIESNSKLLWMQPKEIKELHSEGHIIGLHSHTHPTSMINFSYNKQRNEYYNNKKIIEGIINDKVKSVSYPCNSYNSDTLQIMKELDITLGFRANMKAGYDTLYEMSREDHANILRRMRNENYSFYK